MKAPDWFIKLYTEHSKRADLYGKPWEECADQFYKELLPHAGQILSDFTYANAQVPRSACWPWVESDEPGIEETRRRYFSRPIRDWLYTEEEQAEILKRYPITPDKGIEETNGSPNQQDQP